jgi:hypothetical protein
MALIRFIPTDVTVALPDVEIQGIKLKRKASIHAINIELEAGRVAMNVKVSYYGSDDELLRVPGIVPYVRSLVADNSIIVDATTGETLCTSDVEYLPNPDHVKDNELPERILNPLLVNKDYMYEFELFAALMHQQVVVADIATARILYAESIGRLAE